MKFAKAESASIKRSTVCAICPSRILGFAKLDHHRALRTGMPEVIFAAGKTAEQVQQSRSNGPCRW